VQALFFALAALVPGEERPLATKIDEVTVYPANALVRRVGQAPAGGGEFVIAGLPWSMDPSSVRVRCEGAVLLGLEARERRLSAAPEAREEELRRRIREVEDQLSAVSDERAVVAKAQEHLVALLAFESESRLAGLRAGTLDVEAARRTLEFLGAQIGTRQTKHRELGERLEALRTARDDLQLELGRVQADAAVQARDVVIDLSPGGAGGKVELEYVVSGASWAPLYDLRAAKDARSVELGFRGRVEQQTGEDWSDVSLALSTARPQLGAQGPDPASVWLSLYVPSRGGDAAAPAAAAERPEALKSLGYSGGEADSRRHEAAVEAQGLSVRYRVAQRETVLSRPEPSSVLVGRARLDVTPEYFAAPALDTNVWLRGKTKNTSEWTLLPGRASVYFGADFLGHSELEEVQPGEELTLHLGPDPALTLERVQTEDLREGAGIFSSDASRTQRWRVKFKNSGAAVARPDGAALVHVREALPRATDDRITVKLLETKPAVSTDERWKKDSEERGVLTWTLAVPRGGEALLTWGTKVSFPSDQEVLP
jgi:uncharacterized protein (TIGR02231 family)